MALVGALCACLHVVAGFTNRSLRAQVSTLLGVPYSMGQMTYDLRRLRMKGLIIRLPHSNTYVLTPNGQRIAIFYTKLHARLFLARHRMSAKKAMTQILSKHLLRLREYLDFGTSNIGQQSPVRQRRSQPSNQINDCANRSSQQNNLATLNGFHWIDLDFFDYSFPTRSL